MWIGAKVAWDRMDRARRGTAAVVAVVLVGTMIQAMPAAANPGTGRPEVHSREHKVHGHAIKARPRTADQAAKGDVPQAKARWPRPGSAEVPVPAPKAWARRAAGLPVWVGAPAEPTRRRKGQPGTARAGKVRLRLLDRTSAWRAGVDGLLLTVARTDSAAAPGRVGVRLDYSGFAQAFGGSYGSRLRLERLPACAITTPAHAECRMATPLPTVNDGKAWTLTADVDAAGASGASGSTVLAAAAAPSGSSGDYKATSLAASATWKAGGSSGDFSWSYPMRVPPVPGGLLPQVAVSYSSGSVDGRTANTNGQPSWVGEGFDLWPGFIQRGYKSCKDDGAPKDQWGNSPGDQCWGYDNATITWNGKGGELVPAGSGQWKLKDDDGTRIEKLTDAATGNGDNDGEYWKVTTADGTQYFFGKNSWTPGSPQTKSTWTVPVFGDDSGEPCHDSGGFAGSWCQQAWRWNLDYVVDPHGNAIVYYYTPETNYYGRDLKPEDETPYERGGYLDHIEYGLRSSAMFAKAPARVDFGVSERCMRTTAADCAPSNIGAHPDYWWDVPWDLHCDSGQDCKDDHGSVSPTFWSRKRLTKVTTRALKSDGATYRDVESWALTHDWGLADIDRDLLLTSITHTGDPAGTPLSLPPVTFTYVQGLNRVDKLYDDIPPFIRYRLGSVNDEYGGITDVNYSAEDCKAGDVPTPETNTRRCYPVYWQPAGHDDPIRDWFHKYVVTQVVQTDRTGGAPDIVTNYDYQGGAAWHYDDDDGLTKEKNKTWSQWRGYGKVVETSGGWNDMRAQIDHSYFRGMDGDRLNTSGGAKDVTVSDGEGGTYDDHDSLAGMEVRTVTYDRPGGNTVTKTVNSPWHHETASRTRSWGTVTANLTGVHTTRTLTALSDGGWRETKKTTEHDDTTGLPTQEEDLGDTATAADDRCSTIGYARNAGAWLMNYPSGRRVVALSCDKTPADLPTQLISDEHTYYDGGTFGAAPSKGDVTKIEKAASASGTTVSYVTQAQSTYDTFGRVRTATDAANNTTTTSYTDTSGLNTGVSVASPPVVAGDASTALTTSQAVDPAFGAPVSKTDPGGKITNLAYDGLGRLTKVWLPTRSTAASPNLEFGYAVTDGQPVVVATKALTATGGQNTSYELYDGLLRSRQTQAPGPGGTRLISDTFYDSRGKVSRVYQPYAADGAPATTLFGVDVPGNVETQSAYDYDGLGRVTAERLLVGNGSTQEKWRTTTGYGGDRVNVDPPAGGTPTTTITDARDQKVELRQYKGDSPTGAYDSTTYAYTPAGQLKTINGPGGNTWTYAYDLRGRKIQSSDPDAGTTKVGYDDLDRVTSTEDARGKKLAFTYDPIGRKTAEYDTATSGAKLAEWTYDTARKGRPATATRYAAGAAYTITYSLYDNLNRPLRTTYTIPSVIGEEKLAGSYTFGTNYNLDDTVQSYGFPAAGGLSTEAVVIAYDADRLMRPVRLTGQTSYVTNTNYSPTGKPQQYEMSTGGAKSWLTFGYEYGTQRLTETRVDRENIAGVDRDAVYGYDDAGPVKQITDTSRAGVDNQCFRYDYLQRLTEAWAQGTTTCAADPTGALGGPAPYWQSLTYDVAGNRKTEIIHGTGGNADASRTYSYPAAGQPRPHALSSVTQTGGGEGRTDSFSYDIAGNTTGRNVGDISQILEWDQEGALSKVTEGNKVTSFLYDADGNRLLRRDPTGATLYLPGMELRLAAGAAAATGTRYYIFNGAVVAMRTSGGVQFLVADHHGTAELAINAGSQALAQRRYTPFGQPRGVVPGTWPAAHDKGFVGGTVDPTGLTQLGARGYDPDTGRFISVDPLLDLDDPQSWNGYAYADNNPATLSDPSGESIPCDGGCPNRSKGDEPEPACAVGDCIGVPGYVRDQPGHGTGGTGNFTGGWPDVTGAARPVNPVVHLNLFHQPIVAPDWNTFWNAWYAAADRYRETFPGQAVPDFACDVVSLDCSGGFSQIFLRGGFLDMVCAGPGISCGGAQGSLLTAIAAAGAAGMLGGPDGRTGGKLPKISRQKQDGHIEGTPQHTNRVKQGKNTSVFLEANKADAWTQIAWRRGKATGGAGQEKIYNAGFPIGVGEYGGYQTRIRVVMDGTGNIHGTPWGPEIPRSRWDGRLP